MKFLNGFKTWIGVAGLIATTVVPQYAPAINEAAPHAVNIAQGVFGLLLTLGLIHKGEKKAAAK